jgi:uncharacterized tellurite resistance protein B-like protein
MALMQLKNIVELFRGKELDEEGKRELVREALFMTLSRATAADTNIAGLEIETVQRILREKVGEEFSEKDIRVAAISDLYKDASLDQYLAKAKAKLGDDERRLIVSSLAEVLKADGVVRPFEVEFFNDVVKSLGFSKEDVTSIA